MNDEQFAQLIAAQDRTTYAVRAIATLIIISAIFDVIGGVIFGIALGSPVDPYAQGPK